MSIASGNDIVNELFGSKLNKRLLIFSQLYNFLKSQKEYIYNTDIPHTSDLYKICDNPSLLMTGLNKQKKFKEKLVINPYDLNERFSCNLDEAKCMPEKCISCKSSDWIDEIVLVESTEAKDSEDSSNYANSAGSEGTGSENDAAEVMFYRWQIIDEKITKATIQTSFNDAIEMFKEEVVSLKEHIHIKRRQVNAYRKVKALLTDNDLENDQEDATQSAFLGNLCFSIFTTCCCFNVGGKIRNTNVMVVTEKSDHDRVALMSCLEKILAEIQSKGGKCCKNLYMWSDGMGAQFRSRFVFKLLAGTVLSSKSLMWFHDECHHGIGPLMLLGEQ